MMLSHLLVPLDGSSLAECVLPHAVAIAVPCHAKVTLLHVVEYSRNRNYPQSVDSVEWRMRKAEAQAYLDELTARLGRVDVPAENVLLEGQAAEGIIQFARRHDVDLIILSSHGASGLSGWNVSSVVQKVVYRAYTATMIVRAYQPVSGDIADLRYRRVMVPLDGSQRAEHVLPLVRALARFHGCELLLTHVVRRPEMPRRMPLTPEEIELTNRITERNREEAAKYLEEFQSGLDVNARTEILESEDVAATLHEVAEREGVDLVILSAHGYSGQTKWPYGSVATSFIAYGSTPLLIMQDLSPEAVAPTAAEVTAREHKGH